MVDEKLLVEKAKKVRELRKKNDNPDEIIIAMLDLLLTYELRGNHWNLLDILQGKKDEPDPVSLDH